MPQDKKCDVCDKTGDSAGSLVCGHGFCPDCFSRFIHGSVEELKHALRCCICGVVSPLTEEIDGTPCGVSFGRESQPSLGEPCGICLSPGGLYATAEKTSNRLMIFDQNGSLKDEFALVYKTVTQRGICMASEGVVAVPSKDAKRDFVSLYTVSGAHTGSVYIPNNGHRSNITGIAPTPDGQHLVMVDGTQPRIYVVDVTKQTLRSVCLQTPSKDKSTAFQDIAFTPSGHFLVTDSKNNCVCVFDMEGTLFSTFGQYGVRPGQFRCPLAIAVNSQGLVAVVDRENCRIQMFDLAGKFLRYLVCYKQDDNVYLAPYDVVFFSDERIAVLLTGAKDAKVAEVRVYDI